MGKRKKSTYIDRFIQLNPLQILASGFIFLILLGGLLLKLPISTVHPIRWV